MNIEIKTGKTYKVAYPFIRDVFSLGDGLHKLSWRPGFVWVQSGPDYSTPTAHGIGKVAYRVVDVHSLPRPYPQRVFFVRSWVDPDGNKFGNNGLKVMITSAFRRRLRGFTLPYDDDGELVVRDLDDGQKEKLLEGDR